MASQLGSYDKMMIEIAKSLEQETPKAPVRPKTVVSESAASVTENMFERESGVRGYKQDLEKLVKRLKSEENFALAKEVVATYKAAVRLEEDLADTIKDLKEFLK